MSTQHILRLWLRSASNVDTGGLLGLFSFCLFDWCSSFCLVEAFSCWCCCCYSFCFILFSFLCLCFSLFVFFLLWFWYLSFYFSLLIFFLAFLQYLMWLYDTFIRVNIVFSFLIYFKSPFLPVLVFPPVLSSYSKLGPPSLPSSLAPTVFHIIHISILSPSFLIPSQNTAK